MRMKTATNVSLRSDLAKRARALKINLSQLLETALEERIRQIEREQWLAENQEAIEGYNRRVAKQGVFSQGRRRF